MYLKIEMDSINCHYLVPRTTQFPCLIYMYINVKHFLASSRFSLISRFQNSNDQCIITSDDNAAEMFDG